MKTIQTRSSKRLKETPKKEKTKIKSATSTPSKTKKTIKKSNLEIESEKNKGSPNTCSDIIKQPKVVLEVMSEEQLQKSPYKLSNQEDGICRTYEKYEQTKEKEKILSEKELENDINKKENQSTKTLHNETNLKSESETITEYPSDESDQNKNNKSDKDLEDEEEEENPYDECEIITFDENDTERFIKIYSDSNDDNRQSNNDLISYDASVLNKEMKIFLNDIPVSTKVSEEIELFSKNSNISIVDTSEQNNLDNLEVQQSQQQRRIVKNIPKKREKNAHITHYDDNNHHHHHPQKESFKSSPLLSHTLESLSTTNANEIDKNQENDCNFQSFSTSTPCKPKFRLHYKDRDDKEIKNLNKKIIKE